MCFGRLRSESGDPTCEDFRGARPLLGIFVPMPFCQFPEFAYNPSASAKTGLSGLMALVTERMTEGSGLLGKGKSPVYD